MAFVVVYSGFGTKDFIPSAWEEKLGFLPFLLLLLLLVCLLSFTREYAKTAEKHPLWDMVLKYYSYGLLAISFLGTLFFRAFIMKFAAYFSLVGLLLFLLPGILVRRKNSNFNWLFFSLSPPIIVGLLMSLQRVGVLKVFYMLFLFSWGLQYNLAPKGVLKLKLECAQIPMLKYV